ncbi:MAG: metalloregulator ArsR/SmtB family transcription factor [Betaproteobacteria bacterium]|nr:metalloregulator ArsR/SmtB family transcription factor [Betaproteobacteria bacterium]
MESETAVQSLAALAQASRLAIFRLLVEAGPRGLNAGAIAERLALPAATLSFHVAQLTRAGLVSARQESRFIYYAADFAAMDQLIAFLTANCCQGASPCLPLTAAAGAGISAAAAQTNEGSSVVPDRIFHVLFLCTGNSARSILAEALLNAMGRGRLRAFSAGSHPAGRVNPFAIELLRKNGLPVEDLRSKNWDEFAQPGAPAMDFVFTVCDGAAGEVCPVWPGQPMTAHWGIPDPAAVQGSDADKRKAFFTAYSQLQHRMSIFTSLPLDKLDRLALKQRLDEIGRSAS